MGLSPQRNLPPKLKKFNLAPLPTKGHRQMPFCFIKIIFPKTTPTQLYGCFFLNRKDSLKAPSPSGKRQTTITNQFYGRNRLPNG